MENYGRLPLHFIENRGQVNKQVKYYTQGQGQTLFFTKKGMVMALNRPSEKGAKGQQPALNDLHGQRGKIEGKNEKFWPAGIPQEISRPGNRFSRRKKEPPQGPVVRLTPVGMRKGVKIEALAPQDYKVNYLLGNNPKRWRTNVPTYKEVVYREAYAGIDLKFYGNGQQLEYDIMVKAGADPGQVKFQYCGIKGLDLTKGGDLTITLPDGGSLVQRKPKIYQEIAGQRVFRDGKFKISKNQAGLIYGFDVAGYNEKFALVIDPVIEYSVYLQGSDADDNNFGHNIAVDGAGNAYITGYTKSTDFPTKDPRYADLWGLADAFVTKINPTGGLAFSTYLGGSGTEIGRGIALDREGTIYVTGITTSNDFPITADGLYPALCGPSDAFVSKISNDGSQLLYSTYLGGTGTESPIDIAVDRIGNIYVT